MKKLIIIVVVVLATLVGSLAYIGVVPFLSPLIAQPKDLGIDSDPALVAAFDQRNNMKNQIPGGVVPGDRQAEFSGSTKLDVELSSQEVTSILNVWKARSPKLPIRDIQVRFNEDGTAEISGVLEIKTAISIAKSLGYSDGDIQKGKSYAKYVAGDLPFYVKGDGSVLDNAVSLSPTTFQLGRLTVPESITNQAKSVVEDMIEKRIKQVGSIEVESLTHDTGKLQFLGTVPDTIK
jgi:hypothetical protein